MAKEQIAVCEHVREVSVTKNGKTENKEIYLFKMEGVEFEVWESQYFKAKEGQKFRPVVSIKAKGYNDSKGQARARMTPVVDWEIA